ncbi:MAG TPA: LacI family DNA-binding transcriptional regulator [Chthoniobacteraceae bacterium]|nr:LacI family DNA-binding transcriptional regulator [Chthoniobacteraceae bacterium]
MNKNDRVSPARVTQKQIAALAAVHRTTVCLALSDSPRIPAATKKRVLKIARELGYRPDPMLSALAVYRKSNSPVSYRATIGWISHKEGTYDFRKRPQYLHYYQGAKRRAASLGYNLEVFEFGSELTTPKRLSQILRARGIAGLLVAPPAGMSIELPLDWQHFSAVTFGYALQKPALHTVAAAHYRDTKRATQELLKRGYRRLGLVIRIRTDERCDNNIHAAFLVECVRAGVDISIPPLFDFEFEECSALKQWIQDHRPDGIVTASPGLVGALRRLGVNTPAEVGVACLSQIQEPGAPAGISGIVENGEQIGVKAVDTLVSLMHHNERGIPEVAMRIHLEGNWQEGKTVRSPSEPRKKVLSTSPSKEV